MSRFSSTVVTNKPSSVYFGKKSGDNFPITENIKYKYDSMGNISRIEENGEPVVWYKYDALNRLVREDNKTFGKTWLYSYDNKGNILSKWETSFTLKENAEESEFTRVQYEYDGDKLLTFGTESCAYDAIGNPTTYRGKSASWSNGRQMVTYDGTAFTYDGLGRRLSKGNITYTYDSNNRIIKQSNGIEFIYDNSGVAGIVYNNATYVYRKDGQGNIAALIDSSGNVVVEYKYDAWGDHVIVLSDSSNENLAKANPFRYRGYYYDEETGLYYLKSRYYDPETGRFLNADDISYLDPETINGLNLYAYCGNNPVMRIDENGNAWWDWLLGAIAVIGMVALSVVSFGIAAPLGAMVVSGIALGAITNIGLGIMSGQCVGEIISGALTGGLLGGAMAFALGLGMLGGAALAGVGAASATLSTAGLSGMGAFVLSSATVSVSYGISYLIDASYTGKKITATNFFASMAKGTFVGASLFGIGGLMGFNGWGLKPKLGLIDKGFYYGIQLLFKNALKIINPVGYEGF